MCTESSKYSWTQRPRTMKVLKIHNSHRVFQIWHTIIRITKWSFYWKALISRARNWINSHTIQRNTFYPNLATPDSNQTPFYNRQIIAHVTDRKLKNRGYYLSIIIAFINSKKMKGKSRHWITLSLHSYLCFVAHLHFLKLCLMKWSISHFISFGTLCKLYLSQTTVKTGLKLFKMNRDSKLHVLYPSSYYFASIPPICKASQQ